MRGDFKRIWCPKHHLIGIICGDDLVIKKAGRTVIIHGTPGENIPIEIQCEHCGRIKKINL